MADTDTRTCTFAEFSSKWRTGFSQVRGGSYNRTVVQDSAPRAGPLHRKRANNGAVIGALDLARQQGTTPSPAHQIRSRSAIVRACLSRSDSIAFGESTGGEFPVVGYLGEGNVLLTDLVQYQARVQAGE